MLGPAIVRGLELTSRSDVPLDTEDVFTSGGSTPGVQLGGM